MAKLEFMNVKMLTAFLRPILGPGCTREQAEDAAKQTMKIMRNTDARKANADAQKMNNLMNFINKIVKDARKLDNLVADEKKARMVDMLLERMRDWARS